MTIGVTTSVIWIVVMLCGIQDISAVQSASVPNLEAMYQATGSKVAASVLQAYLTLLYYSKITRLVTLSTDPADECAKQLACHRNGSPAAAFPGHLRAM